MSPQGERLRSCTIITCEPNEAIEPLHSRMPVILTEDDWPRWLNEVPTTPDEAQEMLRPCAPELLKVWPVDNRVGNVRNQGAALAEPLAVALRSAVMRKKYARHFVAIPYEYEDGEVLPMYDVLEGLNFGGMRWCNGYFGDVKLETGWHALWGCETRRKAKKHRGEGGVPLDMRDINATMSDGRYSRRAHYLTESDPTEQTM